MISLRFPIAPKMQKFAMTKCVSTISGIADIVETFLHSPPEFYGDPKYPPLVSAVKKIGVIIITPIQFFVTRETYLRFAW